MRFDPEDRLFYFSTVMKPDEAEKQASIEHFNAYREECFSEPGKWTRNTMKRNTGEDSKAKAFISLVVSAIAILAIIAAILCIPRKRFDLIPWFMGAVMLIFSVGTLVTPGTGKVNSFGESIAFQRVESVIGILGAAGLVAMNFAYPKDNMTRFGIAVFCEVTFVLFAAMLVKSIGCLMVSKTVYKEEVKATCIGYVRTFESNGNDNMPNIYTVHSPVFEYHYNGEKIQAFYDLLIDGDDGDVEVGSACSLRIDPENPARILGDVKKYVTTPVICAVLALIASVVLFMLQTV